MNNTINSIAIQAVIAWTIALFVPQTYAQTPNDIAIEGAWVRTAVPGQKGTGGFMKITTKQDMQLVGISSPVAGVGEVHEMKMEGDVMKMRALPGGLALPAGKAVELKPGGLHLMLLDLKQALPNNSTVPVTLMFKDKAGKDLKMEIKVPVSVRAPAGAAGASKGADPHAGHAGHKP
jgi:periplasmic copper chaperone A